MSLRLNGSTSGYSELEAPAVAGDLTFTLPSSQGSANNLLKNSGTAGTLEFASNVNIDSSGRLLVGTSSDVSGGIAGEICQAMSSAGAALNLGRNTSSATTADQIGGINFYSFAGSSWQKSASILCQADAAQGDDDKPGRLVFSTTADGASSATNRLIINSGGTVYPATDNSYQLGGGGFRFTAVYAVNGTIQTSDAREKTFVEQSSLGSDFIRALKPVSYKWKVGGNVVSKDENNEDVVTPVEGQRTHWGFIAQEVKEAADAAGVDFGGWILTDKDDPESQQGLRYDQFIAPLTKALQEALSKIETLEASNADLVARITALEAAS